MAAEQLQQLRDIHVPDAPGWWPPAPGWWLLALLAAGALAWLAWRAWANYRRRRPVRQAQRLYDDIYERYCRGELSAHAYLQETNELIKRALIHGLGEHQARRASGETWLALLDAHLQSAEFTRGPGRALGNSRFRPESAATLPAADQERVDEVHRLVERLLHRLAPGSAEPVPAQTAGRP